MTLIAGIRCANGFVICADAQETIGEYRVGVQKIVPIVTENCHFTVAGSGHAELIDAFSVVLARELGRLDEQSHIGDVEGKIEHVLGEFYRHDVTLCPDEDKHIKLLIAVVLAERRQFEVWSTEGVRLRRVSNYELVGWDATLYWESVRKFYREEISIAQGVLTGINALTIAEETSTCVKGPISVAIVRSTGIWMEDPDYVSTLSERLRSYEESLNRLFLACADTAISPLDFERHLGAVAEEVTLLHREHLEDSVRRMLGIGVGKFISPYPQIPLGTMIRTLADGRAEAMYDIDAKKMLTNIIRAQHGSVPEPLQDAQQTTPLESSTALDDEE